MTRTTTKRTSLLAALAAMLMMLALLPAAPAAASHPGGGATAGIATLDGGIGTCGGFSFSGVGAAVTVNPPATAAPNVSASGTYCNPEIAFGDATGTLTFGSVTSTQSCSFIWERVGLIALITFTGGSCGFGAPSAIAAFVPLGAPDSGPVQAAVVGGGIF